MTTIDIARPATTSRQPKHAAPWGGSTELVLVGGPTKADRASRAVRYRKLTAGEALQRPRYARRRSLRRRDRWIRRMHRFVGKGPAR